MKIKKGFSRKFFFVLITILIIGAILFQSLKNSEDVEAATVDVSGCGGVYPCVLTGVAIDSVTLNSNKTVATLSISWINKRYGGQCDLHNHIQTIKITASGPNGYKKTITNYVADKREAVLNANEPDTQKTHAFTNTFDSSSWVSGEYTFSISAYVTQGGSCMQNSTATNVSGNNKTLNFTENRTNNIRVGAYADNVTKSKTSGQRYQNYNPRSSNGSGSVDATINDEIKWGFVVKNNHGTYRTYESLDICTYRGGFSLGGNWNKFNSKYPINANAANGSANNLSGMSCINTTAGDANSNYRKIGSLDAGKTSYLGWSNMGKTQNYYTSYMRYVIKQADVGTTPCQSARSSWKKTDGTWQWVASPWACVNIPYDYGFTCKTNCGNTGSDSDKNKNGPQTYINGLQPTVACKNLVSGATQNNCINLTSPDGSATTTAKFSHSTLNFGPTKRKPTSVTIRHGVSPGGTWGSAGQNNWPVQTSDSIISSLKDIWKKDEAEFNVNFATDAGKIWCSNINVDPGGYTNGTKLGSINSVQRCAHVAYNYSVSVSGSGSLSTNTDGSQSCSGSTTQVGTSSTLTYTITAKSGIVNGSTATQTLPLSYRVIDNYGNVVVGPTKIPTSNNVLLAGQSINISVDTIPQSTAADILSYRIEVSDNDSVWNSSTDPILTIQDSQTNHSTSDASCTNIAKLPQINILGADSYANGIASSNKSFSGSASSIPTSGSWSQYGLLGNRTISTFGSAGFNFNGDTSDKSCKLDFANTSSPGSNCKNSNPLGQLDYSRSQKLPIISTGKNAESISKPPNLGNLPSGIFNYGSENLTIPGSLIKKYRNITIITTGSVTISGNIHPEINANYASLSEVPILTIMAKNIYINQNVTKVYGTLIAENSVYTCNKGYSSGDSALSNNNICGQQLVIDGAVYTGGSPRFNRTFGGEISTMSSPAETVNYVPTLFLAPFARTEDSNASGGWQTINSASMPTRY